MKLLFDQNLSRKLPRLLADIYPNSTHVLLVWRGPRPDSGIWDYARANEFIIVTKDTDYRILSNRLGTPPKVILITSGNGPVEEVAALIRSNAALLQLFHDDDGAGLVELP